MVRLFIIFHDCCHGSFFKSGKANEVLGSALGVLVFTPFAQWKHDHARHHATAGDLDRRGVGDIPTMTVEEYLSASWWKKFTYRIVRSPLILFTIGAFISFGFSSRFWQPGAGRRERWSVIWTDLALAALIAALCILMGWKEYLLIQVPVLLLASSVGVWLFYVQHQFTGVYWERHNRWDFFEAGLRGSSFYKLPAVLQWISGNIGFHHIHHLSPKIPNYKLPKAYKDIPALQIEPLTLGKSLQTIFLNVYDEKLGRLVGFSSLRQYRQSRPA
jgi:omega-6 fatty acid desaturase (delta-12 desaturase)